MLRPQEKVYGLAGFLMVKRYSLAVLKAMLLPGNAPSWPSLIHKIGRAPSLHTFLRCAVRFSSFLFTSLEDHCAYRIFRGFAPEHGVFYAKYSAATSMCRLCARNYTSLCRQSGHGIGFVVPFKDLGVHRGLCTGVSQREREIYAGRPCIVLQRVVVGRVPWCRDYTEPLRWSQPLQSGTWDTLWRQFNSTVE